MPKRLFFAFDPAAGGHRADQAVPQTRQFPDFAGEI
jgi:hypothetical protein